MLTHYRKPVCLSLISTDLPIWSVLETAGTLYQKDQESFHLLLIEPPLQEQNPAEVSAVANRRFLWLEISPYRVSMTMQGNGNLSYRHLWQQGLYGISRYWLRNESSQGSEQMCLRNFTRRLTLTGQPLPHHLRVEYELWSEKVQLGCYVLNLEIYQ